MPEIKFFCLHRKGPKNLELKHLIDIYVQVNSKLIDVHID